MTEGQLTTKDRVNLRLMGLSFCPRCDKVVELLSFERAARVHNTDVQDLTALAETRDLHRLHDSRGRLVICGVSLFELIDRRGTRRLSGAFERAARPEK